MRQALNKKTAAECNSDGGPTIKISSGKNSGPIRLKDWFRKAIPVYAFLIVIQENIFNVILVD